jgi:hypothetical protein
MAGTMRPVHSPNPKPGPPGRPAHPVMVTVSPSSRKVRVEPSARVSGSWPRCEISIRLPHSPAGVPLTVPDPMRSPGRTVAPFTVKWASCWAKVQYMEANEVRVTVVPLRPTSRCTSSPHGRAACRYGSGGGAWDGGATR